jgi:uncharacterized protein with NAD-binding domain and iron-sulfur cluster
VSRRSKGKVVILGGGMAGLATAWRLSEAGWRDRFESITIYQRGCRLGGKGASSRGPNQRIQEHGLHIWLGSYENSFHLLRECYAELDRPTADPTAPIQHWWQALIPAENPGLAEQFGTGWLTWLGTHPRDDRIPGDPHDQGRELTAVAFIERALELLRSFAESLGGPTPSDLLLSPTPETPRTRADNAGVVQRAAVAALLAMADRRLEDLDLDDALRHTLDAIRSAVDYDNNPDHKRAWLLLSLVTTAVRGIVADNLVTRADGFRAINDEEFGDWLLRHGGHPDVLDSAMIRGLYDLVFGYADADPSRPAVSAGVMVFLVGQVLFGYRGALFWKMTAGMGDVVIAPLYQALRRRGVDFEFFHRLDNLRLDADRRRIEAITVGRQVRLADGLDHYEPLTRVGGLPVFPESPRSELIDGDPPADLESHFTEHNDVESYTLRVDEHFDHVVLAVSLGMIPTVAQELLDDRPEWREMTRAVQTIATQAFQIWLRPDEPALGWPSSGATVSAYVRPFETWASMPQTLWAEDWPADESPGTVAYFCGSLAAPWPTTCPGDDYVRRYDTQVRAAAAEFIEDNLALFFPKAFSENGFDWSLLAGGNGERGATALGTQHVSVNIDPSDRYVQSVPGSDRYRIRPDESGYDNLAVAGDWTDCGMNAGCIEAAVMSGLEAANAVLGRGRFYRIRGYYLP